MDYTVKYSLQLTSSFLLHTKVQPETLKILQKPNLNLSFCASESHHKGIMHILSFLLYEFLWLLSDQWFGFYNVEIDGTSALLRIRGSSVHPSGATSFSHRSPPTREDTPGKAIRSAFYTREVWQCINVFTVSLYYRMNAWSRAWLSVS